MVYARIAVAARADAHDVEAHVPVLAAVLGQPGRREPPQPLGLAMGDGLDPGPEGRAAPGLHFAEHDRVAVAPDDVDLALAPAPVAVEDRDPAHPQVRLGGPLAPGAQG